MRLFHNRGCVGCLRHPIARRQCRHVVSTLHAACLFCVCRMAALPHLAVMSRHLTSTTDSSAVVKASMWATKGLDEMKNSHVLLQCVSTTLPLYEQWSKTLARMQKVLQVRCRTQCDLFNSAVVLHA